MNIERALQKMFYKATSYVKHNSSTILTVMAAGGVIFTGISVAKDTKKAIKRTQIAEEKKGEELTTIETVIVTGPAYIPSICIGAATITCIFGANILNQKQQAALTSAYMMLDNSYKNYREKVKEIFGEEADNRIMDSIMLDERNSEIIAYAPGVGGLPYTGEVVTFYERYRKGYFEAPIEAVQNAEYHLNRNFAMRGDATLNEFYEFLGLPPIKEGDVLGWTIDYLIDGFDTPWIDFDHRLTTLEDGLECYIIEMVIPPTLWEEYETE